MPQPPPPTKASRPSRVILRGNKDVTTNSMHTANDIPVVLLSFFDGIGTARLALQSIGAHIVGSFAWETDPECTELVSHHFPDTWHRGDFLADDSKLFAATLMQWYDYEFWLIASAGPPCPDFSRIKGHSSLGRAGKEGQKFSQFCDWMDIFIQEIRAIKDTQVIRRLVENVVAAKDEREHFSTRLGTQPVLVDSADFGWVSRPRLWWTDADWSLAEGTWHRQQDVDRLALNTATPRHLVDWHDHKPSAAAQSQFKLLPCLTTPAPTSAGRPAPNNRTSQFHADTLHRWEADQKQFAPWRYRTEALLTDNQDQLVVPNADIKESLHMLPAA